MNLDTQFKIKNNPLYIKYLRENSYWYKMLNREPNNFKIFEEEVKLNYKLRPSDRISQALDYIEMIETIMSTLK
ncbi:MAG: hypothetical protein E7169_02250 [Firmicutes bacterium]|nr:hypothetical protein [Bacillota bacterium]